MEGWRVNNGDGRHLFGENLREETESSQHFGSSRSFKRAGSPVPRRVLKRVGAGDKSERHKRVSNTAATHTRHTPAMVGFGRTLHPSCVRVNPSSRETCIELAG